MCGGTTRQHFVRAVLATDAVLLWSFHVSSLKSWNICLDTVYIAPVHLCVLCAKTSLPYAYAITVYEIVGCYVYFATTRCKTRGHNCVVAKHTDTGLWRAGPGVVNVNCEQRFHSCGQHSKVIHVTAAVSKAPTKRRSTHRGLKREGQLTEDSEEKVNSQRTKKRRSSHRGLKREGQLNRGLKREGQLHKGLKREGQLTEDSKEKVSTRRTQKLREEEGFYCSRKLRPKSGWHMGVVFCTVFSTHYYVLFSVHLFSVHIIMCSFLYTVFSTHYYGLFSVHCFQYTLLWALFCT